LTPTKSSIMWQAVKTAASQNNYTVFAVVWKLYPCIYHCRYNNYWISMLDVATFIWYFVLPCPGTKINVVMY